MQSNLKSNRDVYKVIAKKRKEMRDFAFCISRKEFFFNFPFHMKKNHEKMNFYLLK